MRAAAAELHGCGHRCAGRGRRRLPPGRPGTGRLGLERRRRGPAAGRSTRSRSCAWPTWDARRRRCESVTGRSTAATCTTWSTRGRAGRASRGWSPSPSSAVDPAVRRGLEQGAAAGRSGGSGRAGRPAPPRRVVDRRPHAHRAQLVDGTPRHLEARPCRLTCAAAQPCTSRSDARRRRLELARGPRRPGALARADGPVAARPGGWPHVVPAACRPGLHRPGAGAPVAHPHHPADDSHPAAHPRRARQRHPGVHGAARGRPSPSTSTPASAGRAPSCRWPPTTGRCR